ncbi:MAG: alanyl-tRNA editing protein [Sulfolobales archaeon]
MEASYCLARQLLMNPRGYEVLVEEVRVPRRKQTKTNIQGRTLVVVYRVSGLLDYPDEVRTHTALHILKGAVVRVLGRDAMWTASTYVEGKHGRLVVQFSRKPLDSELKAIEELANTKIAEDLKVEVVRMPREEAERVYGEVIYDLFKVPETVRELYITIVYDTSGEIWNINACNKQHLPSAKLIGRIVLGKARFRQAKNLLELPFDIEP